MSASSSSPSRPSSPATPASAVSTPRRRRRLLPASKPNSHSPSPSFAPASPFSFFPSTTSPSPFHRFLPSSLRASSVPFAWEHSPGIPKTPARTRSSSSSSKGTMMMKALPLPPSLFSRSCGGGGGADPYDVPADYAAMHHPQSGRLVGKVRRSRRPRLGDAVTEWLSVLSLYRSCKRAAACFASKASKASSVV